MKNTAKLNKTKTEKIIGKLKLKLKNKSKRKSH